MYMGLVKQDRSWVYTTYKSDSIPVRNPTPVLLGDPEMLIHPFISATLTSSLRGEKRKKN